MSDNELGAFLRIRREAVGPAEVGLPDSGRRRTPGLRRAELATLAGLSVEYLTRLEQGRDRHPSMQVLAALADALRLSTDERLHLRILAKRNGGACLGIEPPAREVRPTVRALLERLSPTPAYVVNRLGDVLALNPEYENLAGPAGGLDTDPPNLLRFVFTDARARQVFPEWDRVADDLVATLKRQSGRTDQHGQELAAELCLTGGGEFVRRWRAPLEVPSRSGVVSWVLPDLGEVRMAYETLDLSDGEDLRMVVLIPADGATGPAPEQISRRRDSRIASRPGSAGVELHHQLGVTDHRHLLARGNGQQGRS